MNSYDTPARIYAAGIGVAVADRTINRIKSDGTRETWADVSKRVATGNALLAPNTDDFDAEFHDMNHHLRQASILMSGRHLQHGDETQPTRVQEVFTNCSTAAASFVSFYLLLNGSGVGRAYDNAMMAVDWSKMPTVVSVIDWNHEDVKNGTISGYLTPRDAEHLYRADRVRKFMVPDSREGWAEAIMEMEIMAYANTKGAGNEVLILDFSDVRPRGAPIKGMQNRPSSGPGPLMSAIANIARLKGTTMERWRQAMYVDHYLAECVLVGGARRAARMATKDWRDANVFDFIGVKKGGFLWSSNNSVTVDKQFWDLVRNPAVNNGSKHAKAVFEAVCSHSYHDGTGEPGLINQDMLVAKNEGLDDEVFKTGNFVSNAKLNITNEARGLMADLAGRFAKADYKMITNPCGEITLTKLGGYCVIADVVPYHAADLDDAEDAFRVATRALIRTNLMDCLYRAEVDRTNRIGVGITGLHEFAWRFFGFGFRDIIDEDKARGFWTTLSRFKRAVADEARAYATELGVQVPHTDTTIKPAGTTSKLFGLSEGAHLSALREYLRYVQFRNDDPLVKQYADMGYPIKELQSYAGTTVVGFPTIPEICKLGMGDKLVTAPEATPEEQYQYLRLMEKYWIVGVDADGVALPESGNQVSYTLKYDPKVVSYEDFKRTLQDGQASVRCCSVMPSTDGSAYEYQPEQPVSPEEFLAIVAGIKNPGIKEDIGFEHVDCGSGACPINFEEGELEDGAGTALAIPAQDKIYVFSTKTCPACVIAKKLLTDQGLEYEEIDIQNAEGFGFLRTFTKTKSIPVIVVADRDGRGDEVLEGVPMLQAWLSGFDPS